MTQDPTLGVLCNSTDSQQEILSEYRFIHHQQQLMFSVSQEQQQQQHNTQDELTSSDSMTQDNFHEISEALLLTTMDDTNLYLTSTNSDSILKNIPSSDLINLRPIDIQTLAKEESFYGHFEILAEKSSPDIETADIKQDNEEDTKKPILLNYVKNPFPKLEEHDDGKYGFEMNLQAHNSKGSKHTSEYSPKLNKIFIMANTILYIDAVYSAKAQIEQNLFLRVMMVFIDEISSTVVRCANHMVSDNSEDCVKYNMIRCENSNVKYLGKHDDQNDRLCILIPLVKMKPDLDGLVKQSIGLRFMCKNSCLGRRQTALIFTLENEHHIEKGKRFINVRVCSCPKRDRKRDEDEIEKKRKGDDSILPPGKKILKPTVKVKEEEPSTLFPSVNLSSKSSDLQDSIPDTNDDLELRILFPDKELKKKAIDFIYDSLAGRFSDDHNLVNDAKFKNCFKTVRKLRASLRNTDEPAKDSKRD